MDEITKKTGLVTLSCEHSFHFRCIDSWFTKQVWEELDQTCPCCRSKGDEMDRCEIQEFDEEEEEEDDDESYEDDEESEAASTVSDDDSMSDIRWERTGPGRWFVVSNREVAYESIRNLFGPLNEFEEEETPVTVAARKIQAIYRGYKVRDVQQTQQAARALMSLAA